MSLYKRFLGRGLSALISLMITVCVVLGIFYAYVEIQLPDVSVLKDVKLQVPMRVYSSDGKLIAEYGAKRCIPIVLNQVPQQMINAVLATEDARFYSHPGVDFIGLLRAFKAVVQSGQKVQGASTITMQVARNFFLTSKKTYSRKIKEILLALKIEKEFSKDKILELYLNRVYFGRRAYGVAAAAQVYYGKNLNQLTLPEMAMIAGLPQAPSRDNPLINPSAALDRRNHVLQRMYEVGFINKAQYDAAINVPSTAAFHGQRVQLDAPYVGEMVRQELLAHYGEDIYDSGVQVYTTISSKLQAASDQALRDGLIAYSWRHGFEKPTENLGVPSSSNLANWLQKINETDVYGGLYPAAVLHNENNIVSVLLGDGEKVNLRAANLEGPPRLASSLVRVGDVVRVRKTQDGQWELSQLPKVEGAIISMNPQNGSIYGLAGGFDYQLSSFNRAIQAQRQPGSNFKPFIYSGALEKGYTWASVINDAPVVMHDDSLHGLWRPNNDTMKFYGPTRLRVALAKSRNLVSIRLLQDIGISYALNYIQRFGFDSNKLPRGLSLALGSGVVTPLQIIQGYAVFANGGYRITPYLIQRIDDQNGHAVYQAKPPLACAACITNPDVPKDQQPNPEAPQVITPQNAYLMTNALKDVIQMGGATATAAQVLHRPDLAGKTGTTNQQVDAWFSGYNSNLVTTVWVGYDDLKTLNEYGAQAALPIWIQYMEQALQGTPNADIAQPPGINTVRIDPNTGLLAQAGQDSVFEVFYKQFTPQQVSSGVQDQAQILGAGGNSDPLF